MKKKCEICNCSKFEKVWFDKIRKSSKTFTQNKEKILKCIKCDLIFLNKVRKNLEDSSLSRMLYNKNNSIKEFKKFHGPRENKKINFLLKYLDLKNKKILESNCGAGLILSKVKKYSKTTTGIDSIHYKKYLESKGHIHFANLKEVIKKNEKYDYIFSLSELEHKISPKKFLLDLRKMLSKNGRLFIRVPNYNNIYMYLLGDHFLKYDYRTSHNYYFSNKNLNLLFKKTKFKIEKTMGFHEYDMNHLIEFSKTRKRVYGKYRKIFLNNENIELLDNIEKNYISTSLIFILSKK
jgi:2-polyprenyl-3-methyl-5-hydroxy-6-metoxy-1,4-benzoquinol methylase